VLPNAAEKIGDSRYRPERRFVMSQGKSRDTGCDNAQSEADGARNERNQPRTARADGKQSSTKSSLKPRLRQSHPSNRYSACQTTRAV
jgi:hypothetical protein